MTIAGAENIAEKLKAEPYRQHKALLNETGMVIFPASVQHATVKSHGLSYEEDYKGNALAVIFDAHKFEIRWHRDFSEERVRLLLAELRKHPELEAFQNHLLTYQGRKI